MTSKRIARSEDSVISYTVSSGTGPEVFFLNGAFSGSKSWHKVLQALPTDFHTVTFDARGRGHSPSHTDYSFAGALEDVGSVVSAAKLSRPILVGWSHGATLALRHAATHPGTVAGIVLIDGAFPIRVFHEKAQRRIRHQYRLLRAPMAALGALGVLSKMAHDQAAELVVELDEIDAGLIPDYQVLDCPALLIVGSGPHPGSPSQEMLLMRSAASTACKANKLVRVQATVDSNHLQILRRDADVVAQAIISIASGVTFAS
ncbi:hypothetical protein CQ018_08160 [Arthrobacter sp. MYb227]|uniref:alpha/beta fold hydrolase n=1 Tax=Arthrobacter sp. MYb227 TaxID=1848601 RepID=UPI000CFC7297|nr:alpha/beta hydrolase [Arthrobacter sp. MYb227]PQZ93629.1 hypothetical protein CQ018_08160 [Arthrobacter sp. MYb227]